MKKIFLIFFCIFITLIAAENKKIMVTGYWNPTGQMISEFSTDPELNPEGWQGENWQNSGYDIYSFFPKPGEYTGDFEVDYQDTWQDFWTKVEELEPFAIVSFGAGNGPWEIEYRSRNLENWVNDYEAPFQPTPNPPDSTIAIDSYRYSTLPIDEISEAVNENTDIMAWIDWNGDPGAFLCEYIAYLGMWYENSQDNFSQTPCVSAGFIHVNNSVSVEDATEAVHYTLHNVVEYLNTFSTIQANVTTESSDTDNIKLALLGDRDYYFEMDENGQMEIPLIPAGEYIISAVQEDYFYASTETLIDSVNNSFNLDLQEWFFDERISYYNEPEEILSFSTGGTRIAAIKLTEDELTDNTGNLLSKIRFKAVDSSENCSISIVVYEGNTGNDPDNLVYKRSVEKSFLTGDIVEHLIEAPISIEEDKEYFAGYEITSSDGKIVWIDAGPVEEGKGGWINLGWWAQVDEITSYNGNFAIEAEIYSPQLNSVEEVPIAQAIRLRNYPNPFTVNSQRNNNTNIRFNLAVNSHVIIDIFNIKGQRVKKLLNNTLEIGEHNISWNGKNSTNNYVSSGVYFYKIIIDNKTTTKKMLLLK